MGSKGGADGSVPMGPDSPAPTSSPGGGITSLNGGTGAATLASADGSITISGAAPTLDLKVTTAAQPAATWALGVTRFYACDDQAGNDSNAGFSDVSSAAAGLVAKKSLAALSAIIPRVGVARTMVIAIHARAANAQYADGLDFLTGLIGYKSVTVVGTDTVASAGAVAFAGDAADQICLGARICPGTSALGYNPTGSPTNLLVQCTIAGGGAPGFAAEPAFPVGARMRYSSTTTTVALRNNCQSINAVPASDTLGLGKALAAVPIASDVFYIEVPGVLVASNGGAGQVGSLSGIMNGSSSCKTMLAGFDFSNAFTAPSNLFELNSAFCRFQGGVSALDSDVFFNNQYTYATSIAAIRGVGGCIFEAAVSLFTGYWTADSTCIRSNLTLVNPLFLDFQIGPVISAGVLVQGGAGAPISSASGLLGTRTSAVPPVRIIGPLAAAGVGKISGLSLCGFKGAIGHVDLTKMGAAPAVSIVGMCDLYMIGDTSNVACLTGSTGNTDVGLDLTLSVGSRIFIRFLAAMTVTGTAGDIRLADGTIITWAQAFAGVTDTAGNMLFGPGNAPTHYTAVAAGTGVLAVTNAPAGATTFARYVKVPDGAGGFYTFGSLT